MKGSLNVFKALGDENRLKIFTLLVESEYCVGGLAKVLGISDSAVSQQLNVLKSCGLVEGKKVGYYTHYSVDKDKHKNLIDLSMELSRR